MPGALVCRSHRNASASRHSPNRIWLTQLPPPTLPLDVRPEPSWVLDTLLIIVVLFSGGPVNGHMTRCRPPSHMPLRQDEHYSYLRGRSCRHDFWDRVNYVPLDSSGSRYLTIGGEVREWYEGYHNGNWGSGPQDAQDENGYSCYAPRSIATGMFAATFDSSDS